MALGFEWRAVEARLDALSAHRELQPTIAAMKRILRILETDPGLADVQRGVSHAAIRLGYPNTPEFLLIGWTKHQGFTVSIWEPSGDVRTQTVEDENNVPPLIHRCLKWLQDPDPTNPLPSSK
jgi:hypothetical protein